MHRIGPSCGPRGIRSFKGWAQWPWSARCCFLGLHASQGEGAPRGMFRAGQGPNVLCHFPLISLTCGSEATRLWDQGFPEGAPLPTGVRKPWARLLGLGMGMCTRRCCERGSCRSHSQGSSSWVLSAGLRTSAPTTGPGCGCCCLPLPLMTLGSYTPKRWPIPVQTG